MKQLTKKIIPMIKQKVFRANYIPARLLTHRRGGLPPHALLDDHFVRSDNWERRVFHSSWAKEVLVYPEKGGRFQKGRDIVDSQTKWVLPWGEVAKMVSPESIIGPNVGLFVDPGIKEFDEDRVSDNGYPPFISRATISSVVSIIVLPNFIQESDTPGKVDEQTRIPLAMSAIEDLTLEEKRWLFRIDGIGVRPFQRTCDNGRGSRYHVYACFEPSMIADVAYVESRIESPEPLIIAQDKPRIDIEQLQAHVSEADAELTRINKSIPLEQTRATEGLLRFLKNMVKKQ